MPNSYHLNINHQQKTWSLTINNIVVESNQTKLLNRVELVNIFTNHGYGEDMPHSSPAMYCRTDEGELAAFDVYKQLILNNFKP